MKLLKRFLSKRFISTPIRAIALVAVLGPIATAANAAKGEVDQKLLDVANCYRSEAFQSLVRQNPELAPNWVLKYAQTDPEMLKNGHSFETFLLESINQEAFDEYVKEGGWFFNQMLYNFFIRADNHINGEQLQILLDEEKAVFEGIQKCVRDNNHEF